MGLYLRAVVRFACYEVPQVLHSQNSCKTMSGRFQCADMHPGRRSAALRGRELVHETHVRAHRAQSSSTPLCQRLNVIMTRWHGLIQIARNPYRPELHYMRGRGPKMVRKASRSHRKLPALTCHWYACFERADICATAPAHRDMQPEAHCVESIKTVVAFGFFGCRVRRSAGPMAITIMGRFVCGNLPDSAVPAGPLCPVVPQEPEESGRVKRLLPAMQHEGNARPAIPLAEAAE